MDDKTRETLDIFKKISAVPRCSGHEKDIAEWLGTWAENNGLEYKIDSVGNLVIKVPATEGYENAAGIIFQGHLDMVCEKTPASTHDFSKDPISFVYDGDWLKADKTTLGADNGIGIALGLSIAIDKTVPHPPLELLFTVEEETGLRGAESLTPGFIDGTFLINVDSEDEGVFTVGSAGGRMLLIEYSVSTEPRPDTLGAYRLQVGGLRGGHSGVDIHERRGNANKILAETLALLKDETDIRLLSIKGGSLSNAIPRDAEAVIACESDRLQTLQKVVSEFEQTLRRKYTDSDPSISIGLSEAGPENVPVTALVKESADIAIQLLSDLPDGVVGMSPDIEGLVETSNNVATVALNETTMTILCFMRSSVMAKMDDLTSKIEALSKKAGAGLTKEGEFPPWEPNMASPLLAKFQKAYRDLYEKEPEVSVIHAGLECGTIGSKYPGLDMISLGPDIKNPHSPDEKLYIPSVGKIREFLVSILKSS